TSGDRAETARAEVAPEHAQETAGRIARPTDQARGKAGHLGQSQPSRVPGPPQAGDRPPQSATRGSASRIGAGPTRADQVKAGHAESRESQGRLTSHRLSRTLMPPCRSGPRQGSK